MHLPPHSYIRVDDYPSMEAFGEHVHKVSSLSCAAEVALRHRQVASDQRLYEEYFAWTQHYRVAHPYQLLERTCVYALRNGRAEKPPINIAALRDASTCGQ